jgi:hypothetical protein
LLDGTAGADPPSYRAGATHLSIDAHDITPIGPTCHSETVQISGLEPVRLLRSFISRIPLSL